MRDSLKLTTPLIPQEGISSKYKPQSEVAIEGSQPDRVNKPNKEHAIDDKKSDNKFLNDNINKRIFSPILSNPSEISDSLKKIFSFLEYGLKSTSESVRRDPIRALFDSLYLTADEMVKSMVSQEKSSNLYKGTVFDTFREFIEKYNHNEKIKNAVVEIMKIYDCSVNSRNSLKAIINNCRSILDFLLTGDRKQFAQYLNELHSMLLPDEEMGSEGKKGNVPLKGADSGNPQNTGSVRGEESGTQGSENTRNASNIEKTQWTSLTKTNSAANNESALVSRHGQSSELSQPETAKLLKSSLIPLLGEIVAKYYQDENIRNTVMTVVHNLVRYDKGDPELLRQAIANFATEIRMVANVPEDFEFEILKKLNDYAITAQGSQDKTLSTITEIISRVIDDTSNVGIARQAEGILISMLYNESPVMNLLHYILPLKIGNDKAFAEMYVDPDNNEKKSETADGVRKIFLSISSDYHGNFELCFWAYNKKIDFTLWCPEPLLDTLKAQKDSFRNIMQSRGYSLGIYNITEYSKPQSIAQVFPRLINKKVGINVKV